MAQNGPGGILVTAYGYTTKAKDGPLSATSPTGMPKTSERLPR